MFDIVSESCTTETTKQHNNNNSGNQHTCCFTEPHTEETKSTVDETDIFHYIGGCIVRNVRKSPANKLAKWSYFNILQRLQSDKQSEYSRDRQPVTCLLDRGGLTHLKPSRCFLSYRKWKRNRTQVEVCK